MVLLVHIIAKFASICGKQWLRVLYIGQIQLLQNLKHSKAFVCFCSGNFFWFSPNMYNVNLIHIKYTLDFRSDEIFFPSPKHFSNLVQKKESNTSSCLTCLYLTASARKYIFTPILTKGLHSYSNIRVSTLRPTPYYLHLNADIRKIAIPFAQNRFHSLASQESWGLTVRNFKWEIPMKSLCPQHVATISSSTVKKSR